VKFAAAELVRFCVLLSLYVPVAVSRCVLPGNMDTAEGLMAIETNVGGGTEDF
jgi:hypothetical protein